MFRDSSNQLQEIRGKKGRRHIVRHSAWWKKVAEEKEKVKERLPPGRSKNSAE